jgi:hypothetical protein
MWPAPVGAQVDSAELARRILGDNLELRNAALGAVEGAGVRTADRRLRTTLMVALLREAAVHTRQYHAAQRGQPLDALPDPEFVAKLARLVAELRDPAAIPALTAALFTGPLVARALAAFGEPAAGPVLLAVSMRDGWYDTVDGGLIALRFMVEQRQQRPLSARTLTRIRTAAEQRMAGQQYFTTLSRAMDLAAVLGDARLRTTIQRLALDPAEVAARGVQNPALVTHVQEHAAARLAGVPPLPRP